MHCFPFLCWIKFFSGCFRQVFFIWGAKKLVADCVRQVVVLYSNDCMGNGLGRLSIGCLRQVVRVPVNFLKNVLLFSNVLVCIVCHFCVLVKKTDLSKLKIKYFLSYLF